MIEVLIHLIYIIPVVLYFALMFYMVYTIDK